MCAPALCAQLNALRTDADPPHLREAESAAAAAREIRLRAAERGITLAQQQAQDRVRVTGGVTLTPLLIFFCASSLP